MQLAYHEVAMMGPGLHGVPKGPGKFQIGPHTDSAIPVQGCNYGTSSVVLMPGDTLYVSQNGAVRKKTSPYPNQHPYQRLLQDRGLPGGDRRFLQLRSPNAVADQAYPNCYEVLGNAIETREGPVICISNAIGIIVYGGKDRSRVERITVDRRRIHQRLVLIWLAQNTLNRRPTQTNRYHGHKLSRR